LFVRRVFLSRGTFHKMIGTRREHRVQITGRVRLEALKAAEFIEEATGDDENVFHE